MWPWHEPERCYTAVIRALHVSCKRNISAYLLWSFVRQAVMCGSHMTEVMHVTSTATSRGRRPPHGLRAMPVDPIRGFLPDLELLPGALQPKALHPNSLVIHRMHGLAAVQHHLQRRDGAAQLGHHPGARIHHRSIRLKLCPKRLQWHISHFKIGSLRALGRAQ